MRGLILCGGRATRLPNKPLLPVWQPGQPIKPMLIAAIQSAYALGCDDVMLLHNPLTPLFDIATAYDPSLLGSEDAHSGLLGALLGAISHRDSGFEEQEFAVLCCDNVYPEMKPGFRRGAVVRKMPPGRAQDLDMYVVGRYTMRGFASGPFLALTTPWFVTRADIRLATHSDSVPGWMNAISLPAIEEPAVGWDDLGTVASYSAHWKSYHA